MDKIAKIAKKVLDQSALLHIKGVHAGSATTLLAYKISEHIRAQFKLEEKPIWYGTPEPTVLNEQEQRKGE